MSQSKGQQFSSYGRLPQTADPRTLEEIQRRTPRVAGKVEITHLPAGTVITPFSEPAPQPYTLPFHPLGFSGNTNAILQPAHVLVRHVELKDAEGVKINEPLIDGSSMWADPLPPLQLAGDVSFNYLTFNTNELGLPTTEFNVVSLSSIQNSTYHIPPDADDTGGVNGVYYVELFRTNFNQTNSADQVTLKWGGVFPWYSDLWAGTHPSGVGAQPFIGFDEDADRYQFRTHYGGHGHNTVQLPTFINHFFCGRNIGTSGSNIAYVYTGNTQTDCAEFNILTERTDGGLSQVSVEQTDNESPISIHGNGFDHTYNFTNCNGAVMSSITVVDGLVTNGVVAAGSGTTNITLGNCP